MQGLLVSHCWQTAKLSALYNLELLPHDGQSCFLKLVHSTYGNSYAVYKVGVSFQPHHHIHHTEAWCCPPKSYPSFLFNLKNLRITVSLLLGLKVATNALFGG